MNSPIIISIFVLSGIGILSGVILVIASKIFMVQTEPRAEEIEGLLPGANCGGCGYPGCKGLAEAIVAGNAPVTACPATKDYSAIAQVMGVTVEPVTVRKVAKLRCLGGKEETTNRFVYQGVLDCDAAQAMAGGFKGCTYGCLGLGSCAKACPFGAITMTVNGLPQVDEGLCTACGVCVNTCPRSLFALLPEGDPVTVLCQSQAKGPEVRKVCKVGCIGCGICVKNCPVSAITLNDNLAVIDPQLCTACGVCIEKCPMKTIRGTVSPARTIEATGA
ncbi:MAG TPA: RnfABCDGE type electron transport complex subunit B [Firmicutes bacterium]|jgi:electron transport complex protein RnfB|nr:RnfABCDGE type electron transport complex subunit B [Bacillota bacterium]HOQ24020.1 RnfABCDGE type electron transport complex subunit B [Bacillota bacterium]HPT67418.1 RnfABCDGE type electron transport complex subunit B [Bacillota bacterium]